MVALKEDGYYHYPHFDEKLFISANDEIDQVPISLRSTLVKFVTDYNTIGSIYGVRTC